MRQSLVFVLAMLIVVSGVEAGNLIAAPGPGAGSQTPTITGPSLPTNLTAPTCLLGSEIVPQCIQVSVGPNLYVGKATINANFTNTSNMTLGLGDYMFYDNIKATNGVLVHQSYCAVLAPDALLPPGGTWGCTDASWTIPTGTYVALFYIYSISMQRVIGSTSATITSPNGVMWGCVMGTNPPIQPQYVSILGEILSLPSFIRYSDGRCWTWEGTFVAGAPGTGNQDTFVFAHFNDTVWYPCGPNEPSSLKIDAEAYVVPFISTGGNVTEVSITPYSYQGTSCPG